VFLAVSAKSLPQIVIPRFFLSALVFIAACQNKSDSASSARDLKEEARLHQAGLVLVSDLERAGEWEKLIHLQMGVPSRKIEVKAGPGLTTIIIRELKNRADAESVAQGLRDYAEKNPEKYGPTKVEINLNNAAPTISPFVLPTEGGTGLVNPGSALPTLSLPPLQLDGR
jgi:hypothetical protein